MYTKDQILFESAYVSDYTKLDVATEMICENYFDTMCYTDDLDEFTEAGEGFVATIKKFISKVADQISKFFHSIAEKFNNNATKQKISKKFADLIAEAKAKGAKFVEGPNVAKLKKVVEKSKQFVMKAKSELKQKLNEIVRLAGKARGEVSELTKKQRKKAAKEVEKYCETLDASYSKIEKEFEEVKDEKEKISVDKLEGMAKEGQDWCAEVEKCGEEMKETVEDFTDVLKEYQEVVESVKTTDDLSVFQESEEDGSYTPQALFSKVVNTIKKYCDKHARFMQFICTVCYVSGTFTVIGGILTLNPVKAVAGNVAVSVGGSGMVYYKGKADENKAARKAEKQAQRGANRS